MIEKAIKVLGASVLLVLAAWIQRKLRGMEMARRQKYNKDLGGRHFIGKLKKFILFMLTRIQVEYFYQLAKLVKRIFFY